MIENRPGEEGLKRVIVVVCVVPEARLVKMLGEFRSPEEPVAAAEVPFVGAFEKLQG